MIHARREFRLEVDTEYTQQTSEGNGRNRKRSSKSSVLHSQQVTQQLRLVVFRGGLGELLGLLVYSGGDIVDLGADR